MQNYQFDHHNGLKREFAVKAISWVGVSQWPADAKACLESPLSSEAPSLPADHPVPVTSPCSTSLSLPALPPGGHRRRGARGGSPKRLYKAPTHYAKPRQIIQSPETLYKDMKCETKLQNVRHELKIINKSSNTY